MANKNSPVIGDNGVNASKDDLRALSRYAMHIFEHDAPDINDAVAVRDSIIEYFALCEKEGLRPSNLGLYAYLGLSKQQIHNIVSGRDNVNPVTRDFIQKAQRVLSSYREGLAINNKLNPATAIFWSKNFDGMTDTQTIDVHTDEHNNMLQLSQADIEKRIPVYSDAEIDGE